MKQPFCECIPAGSEIRFARNHRLSLFPLLPWSAYIFLGAALGAVYATVGQSAPSLLHKTILVGLLLLVVGIGLERVSLHIHGQGNFWPTTPDLFIARIGFVATALGLATLIERFLPVLPRTMQSLAEESLLTYIVHVALLYGSSWNPGITSTSAAPWALHMPTCS